MKNLPIVAVVVAKTRKNLKEKLTPVTRNFLCEDRLPKSISKTRKHLARISRQYSRQHKISNKQVLSNLEIRARAKTRKNLCKFMNSLSNPIQFLQKT